MPVVSSVDIIVDAPVKDTISRIGGFHGGDYEECRLLGWGAVWNL
jgi:hypothetical protein